MPKQIVFQEEKSSDIPWSLADPDCLPGPNYDLRGGSRAWCSELSQSHCIWGATVQPHTQSHLTPLFQAATQEWHLPGFVKHTEGPRMKGLKELYIESSILFICSIQNREENSFIVCGLKNLHAVMIMAIRKTNSLYA